MLYGVYEEDGKQYGEFYANSVEYARELLTPARKPISCIDLCVSGKTYAARKADLAEKTKAYQLLDCDMSYGEVAIFTDFFTKNAMRYGLAEEFAENGILYH